MLQAFFAGFEIDCAGDRGGEGLFVAVVGGFGSPSATPGDDCPDQAELDLRARRPHAQR